MRLIVRALATYRLTRLVGQDYITNDVRRWAQKRAPERIAYLLSCPWCISVWLAPLIVAADRSRRKVLTGGVEAMALSCVVGFIALTGFDPPEDFGDSDPSDGLDDDEIE